MIIFIVFFFSVLDVFSCDFGVVILLLVVGYGYFYLVGLSNDVKYLILVVMFSVLSVLLVLLFLLSV